MTKLAKQPAEMTPDEAATVADRVFRKIFALPESVVDDLLLRASGFDFSSQKEALTLTCQVCGVTFEGLRSTAVYCSQKCKSKQARRSANSRLVPGIRGSRKP